jgi:hypothetical protein
MAVTTMRRKLGHWVRGAALVAALAMPAWAGSNVAVVVKSDSRLDALALADLVKLAKGTTKSLPDGTSFMLVMREPAAEDMKGAVRKLFGMTPEELKQLAAKLNEASRSRPYIQFVADDASLLKMVSALPGAVGLVDVYAINSSVKVVKVDGKLPFDAGYVLKGN